MKAHRNSFRPQMPGSALVRLGLPHLLAPGRKPAVRYRDPRHELYVRLRELSLS
ncbi:hypothetical protein [Maricaulis sp.]|uniref:hypothetical protein n=1 Tax=Maricaulis sp. TaxID=1486257 RepID=UPI00261386F7|nr:hypothetical protein [Maricaulis sp.]